MPSPSSPSSLLLTAPHGQETHRFPLHATYDAACAQETLFDRDIRPFLGNALDGINTTLLAYGVTGAGKVTPAPQSTPIVATTTVRDRI